MTSQPPPGLHIIGKYGEALMQRYFKSHGILFDREPILPQTSRRIDFAIRSADGSVVLIEVKTIWKQPPSRGISQVDVYPPIRRHIAEAARQFSRLPDAINVIALAVFPGSFIDISTPRVMLGAMYGDMAFSIPFNTTTGQGDASSGHWGFVPGKGEMLRKEGEEVLPRRSRVAALLSLKAGASFWPDYGGRQQISFPEYVQQAIDQVSAPSMEGPLPHVTLWENAGAKTKVPNDLFTGRMDLRWGVEGQNQFPTFIGEERATKELT